jgi:hypothetical protein
MIAIATKNIWPIVGSLGLLNKLMCIWGLEPFNKLNTEMFIYCLESLNKLKVEMIS